VLDPYLSDSLTEKYAATDKPHVRMTERVIASERLTGVDLVTASRVHTDHLDAATLRPLLRANPAATLLFPEAIRAETTARSDGHRSLGYVLRRGPWTLYHSGDTRLYPG
jgi:L-ascorbate metabolism protein UlaG (beta-lactamase superfamily)